MLQEIEAAYPYLLVFAPRRSQFHAEPAPILSVNTSRTYVEVLANGFSTLCELFYFSV